MKKVQKYFVNSKFCTTFAFGKQNRVALLTFNN